MQEITTKLSSFVFNLHLDKSVDLYDSSRYAETFFIQILNMVYGLNLINMNHYHANYPSIDLGDESAKTAFQITSERTANKIKKTLTKFENHELDNIYDQLYILVLSAEKTPRITHHISENISFKCLNLIDILKRIACLSDRKLELIVDYLNNALASPQIQANRIAAQPDQYIHFSESINLSDFAYKAYAFEVEESIKLVNQQFDDFINLMMKLGRNERCLLYFITSEWDSNREPNKIIVPMSIVECKYTDTTKYIETLRYKNLLDIEDNYNPYNDDRYTTAFRIYFSGRLGQKYDILIALYRYLGDTDFYKLIVNLNLNVFELVV